MATPRPPRTRGISVDFAYTRRPGFETRLIPAIERSRLGPYLRSSVRVLPTRASSIFQPPSRFRWNFVHQPVPRQQPPPAGAELRIAGNSFLRRNQFDSRPDAARILPTASATAQPFAQDGPRRHNSPVFFFERSGKCTNLSRGAHAKRDQTRQQIRTYGEPASLGNIVHLADDFDAATGAAR